MSREYTETSSSWMKKQCCGDITVKKEVRAQFDVPVFWLHIWINMYTALCCSFIYTNMHRIFHLQINQDKRIPKLFNSILLHVSAHVHRKCITCIHMKQLQNVSKCKYRDIITMNKVQCRAIKLLATEWYRPGHGLKHFRQF